MAENYVKQPTRFLGFEALILTMSATIVSYMYQYFLADSRAKFASGKFLCFRRDDEERQRHPRRHQLQEEQLRQRELQRVLPEAERKVRRQNRMSFRIRHLRKRKRWRVRIQIMFRMEQVGAVTRTVLGQEGMLVDSILHIHQLLLIIAHLVSCFCQTYTEEYETSEDLNDILFV